jgi:hypothetical protein
LVLIVPRSILEYSFSTWKSKAIYDNSKFAIWGNNRSNSGSKPMKVHNVALVGAGRMGCLHARNLAANPRFRLAAIADHSEQLATSLANEIGASVAS